MTDKHAAESLIKAARALARKVDTLSFDGSVAYVYNPLHYAWNAHECYLQTYAASQKKVLFLGMNPGPWGMVQTGVPFGEIEAVKNWLGIETKIGKPPREHPKRPVEGFYCSKSEVSGRRLWGLFKERFGTAASFFKDHFVANYCPLVFMESSGRNKTPNTLPAAQTKKLYAACDEHLAKVIDHVHPQWVIGIGAFAAQRLACCIPESSVIKLGRILHPSPASPAANKDWSGAALRQLEALGVW
ncbi:MAG: single-stranded DNA-binding protein [Chitinivibrionales bacterium]|nr:single-stranded DNA-binding protein [Chitinivibrionales bacterium]